MFEILAIKQPTGNFCARKSFETNKVEVQKCDCLFMFSDGYSDPFGGVKGKK